MLFICGPVETTGKPFSPNTHTMKISHSWLQSLIHLPESPAHVAAWLTGLGLEVEATEQVEKVKGNLDGLVVGEVLTCEKHPDADKLKVTTVDAGAGLPLHIVCGAPNVAPGQKVVVALVGATLYPVEGEPFQIKKSKIRGQLSEGMICAEDEIGLGQGHDGIMVLDTQLANGTPAAQHFNLSPEVVYEIGLTPNRIDAASHFGVARDLKAITGRPTSFPAKTPLQAGIGPISIEIEDTTGCKRYAGLLVSGIAVKPSPEWMQNRLKSIGLHPINNVVDTTNYVLHELGQPMHAFDVSKIESGQIHVRRARTGETLTTLDKAERTLLETDFVVADAKKPLALAGVLGGLDGSISPNTTSIFLESAYFEPVSVRKSAQHHGIKTDSSFRFERGADPNMVVEALERAAFLLAECCPEASVRVVTDVYPQPIQNQKFTVHWSNVDRLIGAEIPRETITEILTRLDIEVSAGNAYGHAGFEEEMEVSVPAYRVDVTREADIVEEILRVYGIDNIPVDDALSADFISGRESMKPEKINVRTGQLLADMGFVEIVTNSLTNPRLLEGITDFEAGANVEILNRLSEDLSAMRQTLMFSGLEILAHNINRRQTNLRLFEIGKVYRKKEAGTAENYRLGLYITGLINEPSWETGAVKAQYFHLRKAVENLLARLGVGALLWKSDISTYFQYGQAVYARGQKIAELGMLKPEVARRKDVKQMVGFADLDWDKIRKLAYGKTTVAEVARFPEVKRDLSVVIDRELTFDRMEVLIRQANKNLVKEVSVFDVYVGDKIEPTKKAYAISIVLQDATQTLTDQVIDKTMEHIMTRLEKEAGAFIRR